MVKLKKSNILDANTHRENNVMIMLAQKFSILRYLTILTFILRGDDDSTAQTLPMIFERFSVEEGLPQGSGYSITQDSDGFMWFGTQDGLVRFTGYGFEIFRAQTDTGLLANTMNDIVCDREGKMWVGTPQGVSFKACNQKFFTPFEPLRGRNIHRIFEDRNNHLWILTFDKGLFHISPDRKSVKNLFAEGNYTKRLIDIVESPDGQLWLALRTAIGRYDPLKQDFTLFTLPQLFGKTDKDMTIRCFDVDNEGNLWIGGFDNGVMVFDAQQLPTSALLDVSDTSKRVLDTYKVYTTATDNLNTLASNSITKIFRSLNGDMWIGTKEGLTIYRFNEKRFDRYQHRDDIAFSISANFIISVFQDKQGLFWVGTSGGGISKYDPARNRFDWLRQTTSDKLPLVDNMIYSILKMPDGTLYFGTQSTGLVELKTTGQYTVYKKDETSQHKLFNNTIHGMAYDDIGGLWLATLGGLMRFDIKTKQIKAFTLSKEAPTARLFSICKLKNQDVLLVSGQKGLAFFDLKNQKWLPTEVTKQTNTEGGGLLIEPISARCLFEDEDGQIWLGTEGKGLGLLDWKTKKAQFFTMTAPTTRSVITANDNSLWVGTDNGLVLFDKNRKSIIRHYTTKDGLPNELIYSILKDTDNNIWVATNKGLARLNTKMQTFQPFDVQDGLQSNEFNTNSAFRADDGRMFFGGINGITAFYNQNIVFNAYKPPVHITNFKVFGKDFPFNEDEELRLDYRQNFFTIEFAALNYSLTSKNTYMYQLEGVDPQWVYAGAQHFSNYTNVAGGHYTFKVRASNNDGVWSDHIATFRIHISPPYWETWWFRCLLLSAIGGIFYLFYTYRKERLQMKSKEEVFQRRIAETEMAALRSQMNPHFIFNVLNSINDYMLNHDSKAASQYLTDFSKLIRLVLENSRSEKVTLSKELAALELYLKFEQLRFEHKLHFTIELDENIDTQFIKIPPMLIQPYIENAIWHGLMHRPLGGTVAVRIKQLDEHLLHIEIEDDGIGRVAAAELKSKSAILKKSFGMTITSERIQLVNEIFKTTTQVSIIDLVDTEGGACGTKVIIEIPY